MSDIAGSWLCLTSVFDLGGSWPIETFTDVYDGVSTN